MLRPGGVFVASTFLVATAPLGQLLGDDLVRPLNQVRSATNNTFWEMLAVAFGVRESVTAALLCSNSSSCSELCENPALEHCLRGCSLPRFCPPYDRFAPLYFYATFKGLCEQCGIE